MTKVLIVGWNFAGILCIFSPTYFLELGCRLIKNPFATSELSALLRFSLDFCREVNREEKLLPRSANELEMVCMVGEHFSDQCQSVTC